MTSTTTVAPTSRRGVRPLRIAAGSAVVAAALLGGGVSVASAAPPPSDPQACGAYATGGATTSTMTMKLTGHACGSPLPWWGRVYFQAQMNGKIVYSRTLVCQTGGSAAWASCINNGVTWSTANPAGSQKWEWGGSVEYYSPQTGQRIGTSWSIVTKSY